MERMSSRFFGHMPEVFMEGPPQKSSLNCKTASFRNDALDGQQLGLAMRDHLRSSQLSDYARLHSGGESAVELNESAESHDVFAERLTERATCSAPTGSPTVVIRDATRDEIEVCQAANYDIGLVRFTEMFGYYIRPNVTERWASNLGLTESEWNEKLEESEAQLHMVQAVREEELREGRLEIGRLLMSLYRQQARLEIRKMRNDDIDEAYTTSHDMMQNKKAANFRGSRIFERVRRAAENLHVARQPAQSTEAQTVIAISYSSTSLGLQPIMIPRFPRTESSDNILAQDIPSALFADRPRIRPLTPRMAPPKPAIQVKCATPKSHMLSESEASSVVSTPTRKPGLRQPTLLSQRQHLQGPRRQFKSDSKIPAPLFTGQKQQIETRLTPQCPPRAIAKAVKTLRGSSQEHKSTKVTPSYGKSSALMAFPDVSTNVKAIGSSKIRATAVAEKHPSKAKRTNPTNEDRLLKAREDVARKRSSNRSSALDESRRSSLASFLNARSRSTSRPNSLLSLRQHHKAGKQVRGQQALASLQASKATVPAPSVPVYNIAAPQPTSERTSPLPYIHKPLPKIPNHGKQVANPRDTNSSICPAPRTIKSDTHLPRPTAPQPLSQRQYKMTSISEKTLRPRPTCTNNLRPQPLKRMNAVRDFRKVSGALPEKALPRPPPPSMGRVADMLDVLYAYDEKTARRIKKRNEDMVGMQKAKEMLGFEGEGGMRSSVLGPKNGTLLGKENELVQL